MNAPQAIPAGGGPMSSANDRLKRGFDSWLWGSMIAATVVHVGVFAFTPAMTAADFGIDPDVIMAVDLLPPIDIPPPPDEISRPAAPVIAEATLDEDLTIPRTTFEENPISELPPPPTEVVTDVTAGGVPFTPFTVAPRVLNLAEIQRAMQRAYPSVLRDTGIGGTVTVHFFIDERGQVVETRLAQASEYAALNEAALAVAEIYRFAPAMNRDHIVAVWVEQPITFQVAR